MARSVLLIFFFLLLLNKVTVEETIQGFIGDSADLPCYTGPLKDLTAHWRYNDSLNVFDIQNGRESIKEQDPVYRGRTEMVSKEYMTGNFSLRLTNLRSTDVGSYCCFVPEQNKQQCTGLQVKEKVNEIQGRSSSNRGLESGAGRILPLFISFVSFLLCV